MATKSEQEKQEIYTEPELREKLKAEIKASDKGGKPGQWSARKSQFLVTEYEKAGGDYKNDKPTEAQKDLMEWTAQDWQTADGQIAIRGKKTERYLPKEAWDRLSKAEQQAANATKEKGSTHGEQFVENTDAVKRVMKEMKDEGKAEAEKKATSKTAENTSKSSSRKKSEKKTSKAK